MLGGPIGNWFLADINQNCHDACQAVNRHCSEEHLYLHNVDVDTSEEVLRLVKTLGGIISATSCSGQYGTAKDVPLYSTSDDFCLLSNKARQLSSFDYKMVPIPLSEKKRRLCWCHDSGESRNIL